MSEVVAGNQGRVDIIDAEQLRHAVFEKYGLVISTDDSIFHYLFMHDVILDQYQQFLIKAISSSQQKHLDQAKKVSEQVASKTINAIGQVGNKHEQNLQKIFDEQFERLEVQHQRHVKALARLSWVVLILGGVAALTNILIGLMLV